MIYLLSDFDDRNAEFARGRKPLSKQHKQKISRALKGKGRGKGKKPPTLEGHVVKGAKWGAIAGGGLNALTGAAYGGVLAGPVGAVGGGAIGGGLGVLSGGVTGAGYGAGVYGLRRSFGRRRR